MEKINSPSYNVRYKDEQLKKKSFMHDKLTINETPLQLHEVAFLN